MALVQLAAIWHRYLPLRILYNVLSLIVLVHFFFLSLFSLIWYRSVRQNGRRYQHILALCALLTRVKLKGLTLLKFVFDVCACCVGIGFVD